MKEETSELPSRRMKLLHYLKKTKLSEIEFILFGNFHRLTLQFNFNCFVCHSLHDDSWKSLFWVEQWPCLWLPFLRFQSDVCSVWLPRPVVVYGRNDFSSSFLRRSIWVCSGSIRAVLRVYGSMLRVCVLHGVYSDEGVSLVSNSINVWRR